MTSKNKELENLSKVRSIAEFERDKSLHYPGLEKEGMKGQMTDLINHAIDLFISVVQNNGNDTDFKQAISTGLSYFDTQSHSLDTEDRERICHYFEELMDAIEMEESGGILNKWLYGFDIDSSDK